MHLAQYLEYLNNLVGAHEHWHHFTLVSKLHKLFLVHIFLLELHVHTKVYFTLAAVKLKHVLQIRSIILKDLKNRLRLKEFLKLLLELDFLLSLILILNQSLLCLPFYRFSELNIAHSHLFFLLI